MIKVHMTPPLEQGEPANGVGRVIKAMHRYLPEQGFEFVDNPEEADIRSAHIWSPLANIEILHCHGMEWDGDGLPGYGPTHSEINRAIIETARRARAITVPSEWVAVPFKRDMRISPTVIGHGVDLAEWKPLPLTARKGYVLWNKNRVDAACDPKPAVELAKRGVPVISTFGDPRFMQVTGLLPYEEMKEYVRHASIYLSTAKETFGIGTLEALAAGVPVLAYAHGGAVDLVKHCYNGYLVEPGDTDGLEKGYHWLVENLPAVSKNARKTAKAYDWQKVIGQYATLYQKVWEEKQREQHRVAVIIPCYNYGSYVKEAIESALNQTEKPCEIIVVDDGSTDDSRSVIAGYADANLVRAIYQENLGVAAARNAGIAASEAEYIVCLDADDTLEPDYTRVLRSALQASPELGVAYSDLNICGEGGNCRPWGWHQFEWEHMAQSGPTHTCIPAGAMFRRTMWERAGGYRQQYHPAEDAEFWLRGLSLGFGAKLVTSEPLFNYRVHPGSASRTKVAPSIVTWHPWAKDKQYPMAAPSLKQPQVRSYSRPLVSVVIPVGPGHAKYLPQALNSLLGQTWREWEVIVVNDTNEDWDEVLKPYPFVTIHYTGGNKGAGYARNMGLEAARAPLVLWLDADDWLMPDALKKMLVKFSQSGGRYVYTDWIRVEGSGVSVQHETPEYSAKDWLIRGQHAVTVLMATEDARQVGGFDEELKGWEDWDFFIKCATQGIHGVRLPEPLLAYRMATGTRREESLTSREELLGILRARYREYLEGGKELMGCCGGARYAAQQVQSYFQAQGDQPGKVKLEFVGPEVGTVQFLVNGHTYRAANNDTERYVWADPADVARLTQYGVFQQAA